MPLLAAPQDCISLRVNVACWGGCARTAKIVEVGDLIRPRMAAELVGPLLMQTNRGLRETLIDLGNLLDFRAGHVVNLAGSRFLEQATLVIGHLALALELTARRHGGLCEALNRRARVQDLLGGVLATDPERVRQLRAAQAKSCSRTREDLV